MYDWFYPFIYGYDDSECYFDTPYNMTVGEVVEMMKKQGKSDDEIFDALGFSTYPIFDESHRSTLNWFILRHYWVYKLAWETIPLQKMQTENFMAINMPFFNDRFKTTALEINPLFDTDLKETLQGKDSKQNTTNVKVNDKTNGGMTTKSNSNNTAIGKNTGENKTTYGATETITNNLTETTAETGETIRTYANTDETSTQFNNKRTDALQNTDTSERSNTGTQDTATNSHDSTNTQNSDSGSDVVTTVNSDQVNSTTGNEKHGRTANYSMPASGITPYPPPGAGGASQTPYDPWGEKYINSGVQDTETSTETIGSKQDTNGTVTSTYGKKNEGGSSTQSEGTGKRTDNLKENFQNTHTDTGTQSNEGTGSDTVKHSGTVSDRKDGVGGTKTNTGTASTGKTGSDTTSDKSDTSLVTTINDSGETTNNSTKEGNTDSTSNESGTNEYTKILQGYSGRDPFSLVTAWRSAIINIDKEIVDACSELFGVLY